MKISIPLRKKARIEMLPLIDIVFLLLVFFIYAMFSMAVHRGLDVRLPESSAAEVERADTISVSIDADKQIFLDGQAVKAQELIGMLQKKRNALPDNKETLSVLLFADSTLEYQSLFETMDMIRKAGINNISLQAEARSGQ